MYQDDGFDDQNISQDEFVTVETVTVMSPNSPCSPCRNLVGEAKTTFESYDTMDKPAWAPPAWLFPLVWTVLYILIVVSFGYVFWLGSQGKVSWNVMIPLILNLIFNIIYFPLQFWFKSTILATIDVFLVLATLIWAMAMIWAEAPQDAWTAYILIPYLIWVIFACVLQCAIAYRATRSKCKPPKCQS